MFQLKKLSPDGIERALEKVDRYRLLNEPWEAESICRDVLATDPDNYEALVSLVLALTEQFGREGGGPSPKEIRALLPRLDQEYERAYYEGIICERKGMSLLRRASLGSGPVVFDWLRKAMNAYERAEELHPAGNEDAIVRWNACARIIMSHDHLQPAIHERRVTFLE